MKGNKGLRMCIVCREHLPKEQLIRLVKDSDDNAVIDSDKKIQGRGIYLCNRETCLNDRKTPFVINSVLGCTNGQELIGLLKNNLDENR